MENGFNITDKFTQYKETLLETKRYWIVYIGFILIALASMLFVNNPGHTKLAIVMFLLIAILGIFCIAFYFMHNDDKELYKVAFVVLGDSAKKCSAINFGTVQ